MFPEASQGLESQIAVRRDVDNGVLSAFVSPAARTLPALCAAGIRSLARDKIKQDRHRESFSIALEGRHFFCKVHHGDGLVSILRREVVRRRLLNTHKLIDTLRQKNINLPRVEATLLLRLKPFAWEYATVYEYLEGATTLIRYLQGEAPPADKQGIVDDIVRQLSALHQLRLVHGDMKPNNILIRDGRAYLIDLDGLGPASAGKSPEKDLARFLAGLLESGLPGTEAKRVLLHYAEMAGKAVEPLYRKVKKSADKVLGRHRDRYGRQVGCLPDL